MTIDDHYFETRFTDADGNEIPPQRYRTLQGALADAIVLPDGSYGSIWYQDEPGSPPLEVLRQDADGSMVDALHDDGTNYPLGGVPEGIEPGALMFSLWLEDPDGERAAYDFGFDWDGEHQARWQCSRGDDTDSSWCHGTIQWSNQLIDWIDYDEEPEPDGLGDDLVVTYTSSTSSGASGRSGKVVLGGAAIDQPFDRDSWVAVAEQLFRFLRGRKLV